MSDKQFPDYLDFEFIYDFTRRFCAPVMVPDHGRNHMSPFPPHHHDPALFEYDPRTKMAFHMNMDFETFLNQMKLLNPGDLIIMVPKHEWGYFQMRPEQGSGQYSYKKFVEWIREYYKNSTIHRERHIFRGDQISI